MLEGKITATGDGLGISTRAMLTQMNIMNIHNENITHFGIPGYQQRKPVVTTFVEHLGPQGVDQAVNTEVGRLHLTKNPLDVALNVKGYFQKLRPTGEIELTRDGRFKLDKSGALLSLDNQPVLSASGSPITFKQPVNNPGKEVKFLPNGEVVFYNPLNQKTESMGRLGIVDDYGQPVTTVQVAQGYAEESNVMLQEEFVGLMLPRRDFEANRQLFILQSDSLSRLVQELGRV
jgi:flagellar basal-body rod protein FlgF